MVLRNSKNCVACTMEYGIGPALMSFSCASFAWKYPLCGARRSVPTTDSATWWDTPASASAASRLVVDLLKNSIAAASSKDGEFDTSTTTDAPVRTSGRPSPVTVFTPVEGAAATAL